MTFLSFETLIGFFIGACCVLICALVVRSQANIKRHAEIEMLNERGQNQSAKTLRLEEDLNTAHKHLESLRSQETIYREDITRLKTQMNENQKNFEEKLELLEETKNQLKDMFKGLSHQALESNNKIFLDLAKSELEKQQSTASSHLEKRQNLIGEMLKPLKETLEKVDKRHEEIDRRLSETSTSFKEQITHLARTHQQLQSETNNLVKALRTPQVRGRWGEMTLHRVAELAGMEKHCDFDEQVSQSSDGKVLRPDMVVRLPNNRQIVVDAKTPLQAYLDALEADDEPTRQTALSAHCRQLKTHMSQLADKAYWAQFSSSPEFVVMFVPGENFFSAALSQDPNLIEEGISKGVILATPTTLISLLKAIGYGWRQETLTKNAQQVSQLGRELYQRLAGLTTHFGKLEKNLKLSVEAYNSAVGTLENRVLSSARKFRDLGIEAKSDISETGSLDIHPRSIQAQELTKPLTPLNKEFLEKYS